MNASEKPPLALEKRILSPKQRKLATNKLGAAGEKRAASFLTNKGYQIIATNIAVGKYEIDIIALDPKVNEIVFCEVKTRRSNYFGDPSVAVTPKKLAAIRNVARAYLRQHPKYLQYRYDIISVLPDTIDQFENVTWSGR
ncbi:MAG: YraN family protein [Candidatus Pacebacteria bacterium]|nr:YraN family protein [Candidatus Paceibacterota bacterium]